MRLHLLLLVTHLLLHSPVPKRTKTSTGLQPRGWGSLVYIFEEAKTDSVVGIQGSSEEIKRVYTCHSYASSKLGPEIQGAKLTQRGSLSVPTRASWLYVNVFRVLWLFLFR